MNLLARSEWYWVFFDINPGSYTLGAANSSVAVKLSANEFRAHHKTLALIAEAPSGSSKSFIQTREAPVALGVIASHKPLRQTVHAENRGEDVALELIGDVSCTDLALWLNLDTRKLLRLNIKLIQEQDICNLWRSLRSVLHPREDMALFETSTECLAQWRCFFQKHDVEKQEQLDMKLLTWTSNIAKELVDSNQAVKLLKAFSRVIDWSSKADRQFYLQLAVILADGCTSGASVSFDAVRLLEMSQLQFSHCVGQYTSPQRNKVLAILYAGRVKSQSQSTSPPISCLVQTREYATKILEFL